MKVAVGRRSRVSFVARATAALAVACAGLTGLTSTIATSPAGAVNPSGTVLVTVSGAPGSYAFGFCPTTTSFLGWGSSTCGDGTPNYAAFTTAGSSVGVSVPAGSYNGVLATGPGAFGPQGPVTVVAGQTTACTLSMTAAPVCSAGPPTGTVVVTIGEATGSYATGLCLAPGLPVTGSATCSDGQSANVRFGLTPGATTTYSLAAGSYTGGMALLSPLTGGTYGPIFVTAGATVDCTFTLAAAPSCTYSGVGTGVVTVPSAVGGDPVTIESGPGTTLSAVSSTQPASSAGAGTLPVGVLGFTVSGVGTGGTADVTVTLPPGSNPTGYLKYRNDAWVDFSANATIAGDVVTLHLRDGDAFDTDSRDGVIGDPGAPVVGYSFAGFRSPIDPVPTVNAAKAGQAIPVKWRISSAAGVPVSDPTSFVGLVSSGGPCASAALDELEAYAPGASGLQYLGNGEWQVNWKTEKAWAGQCRTLILELADGLTRTASFQFK